MTICHCLIAPLKSIKSTKMKLMFNLRKVLSVIPGGVGLDVKGSDVRDPKRSIGESCCGAGLGTATGTGTARTEGKLR